MRNFTTLFQRLKTKK